MLFPQENNQGNQAVVTIVGDAPNQMNYQNYDNHDFITNTNPYNQNEEPQLQQELNVQNNNIEPTLENGFHLRFDVNSDKNTEPVNIAGISMDHTSLKAGSSTSTSSSSSAKPKRKAIGMTERKFNAKKRLKSWLPHRKKKYHPHLCGRF
jgi:hypothetical protein